MTGKRNAGPGGCQVPAKYQIIIDGANIRACLASFKREAVLSTPSIKDSFHDVPTFSQ